MTAYYPVMLNLEERTCVFVGGGEVTARKVQSLLGTGARITVISPQIHHKLAELIASGQISAQRTAYAAGMLAAFKPFVVFAATDNEAVNQQVVEEARSLGALANAVSANGEHDFMSMAAIERHSITIGISSGGASPELAAHIRERVSDLIGAEYGTLSVWLGEARPIVQAAIDAQPQRAALWRRIIESPILERLKQGDTSAAREHFDTLIREALANQP
ncbi:MAG: bifunctional precorrin-2 dehydrogenase/sirohydrochlorin ferrochelatase [Chloroflexi bacterium]|nr:bifunctional precorrin-2 dehydrogenase/sirohydrochlorin ferrochelatase [Chloroflexota bacterium]MCC6893682.1 bifunctional precorrin-2 dehydrogenase/sirohydrochlorin ferrochelatase [Anaerolineae bacterium]